MPNENAIKISGANERERERESKRLRRFVINFFLILSLLLQNFLFLVNPVYAASSPWAQTDWSGGSGQTNWSDATKFYSSSNIDNSTTGQLTLSTINNWYNTDWKYRQQITISSSITDADLTNFPALVQITDSSNDLFDKAQSDGDDILFTASDGTTKLDHEIEEYDASGGNEELDAWVEIPTLSSSNNTVIYLYYGNDSASNQENATGTWNSNYRGVWHLGEGLGTVYDSTSNDNDGTAAGTPDYAQVGQIGKAINFTASDNERFNCGNNGTLDLGTGEITAEAWVKTTQSSSYVGIIGDLQSNSGPGYAIENHEGRLRSWYGGGFGYTTMDSIGSINNGAWRFVVITRSGSARKNYIDGSEDGSGSGNTDNVNSSNNFYIGMWGNTTYDFNGLIDEARVSNTARSADWIKASYNTSNSPSTYLSFASEEERYASPGTLTSSIFDTEQGSNWGTLTYNTDGVATTAVKARTSNSSSMTGATDYSSCNAITSGSDVSSNNCVTDTHRYIQYQISLTSVSANTPTFQDVSIAFTASDSTPPSVSLTALSPDPNNDNTPSLSGTATDAAGTVSNVQFQMDATSGSWTACTADDGSFNSATEAFTCNISSALFDGSHTIYVRATDSNSNTTSDVNASTDTFTIDTTGVSVSLTAFTPDPGTDNTPTISGSATATIGTISNVQFQVDSTSGGWSSCTASDGSFNAASENFSCTTSALSDGSHTIYVRATDNASNFSSNTTDAFTVDTTNPASFDLDSPGNDSYTNSERPNFKWKASSDATAGLSKYVLEIDNPSIGSGQPSGDFTIDSIPTSRTTDYETNKYVIHYENFSDSDSANNYISVYTKSHSDWGSSENDGKLREGRVSWKVKAIDNAGNETSSSRTLFVDRSSPKVELTQINDAPFSLTNFSTTDKTPTIFGKITDSLSGGDSSQTQDENGPKIASGPKQVDIKVEKKEGLGYKLITLYTINMDKPWYTCDGKEVSDNSKQKCDKYLPFEYTSKENLELGAYKITLTGKDKADNSSSETTLSLNITTLAQITTPEEKKIIEEEIKPLKPEEQEKVKEELEITKPVEPSALEKAQTQISQTSKNILNTTGNIISAIFNGILRPAQDKVGQGVRFTVDTTGKALAFVGDKAGQALAFVGKATNNTLAALYNGTKSTLAHVGQRIGSGAKAVGQGLAFAGEKTGQGISAAAKGTGDLLVLIGQGIGNTGKTIGQGYNQLANNVPGVAKTILTGIGNGVGATTSTIATIVQNTASTIGNATHTIAITTSTATKNTSNFIAGIANNVGKTTSSIAKNTSKTIGNITSSIVTTTSTIAKNTGSAIASATQNTVNGAKESIAKVSFAIGEKTQDVSDSTAIVFLRIGYSLLTEDTKISNVESVALSPTSVKVSWKTNHPANGKVNWGYEDGSYKFELQESKRTTEHAFILTNLQPDTEYHYEVMSQNKNYVYDANRKFKTPAK